jgi:DNA-binding transcriptional MerR regulator
MFKQQNLSMRQLARLAKVSVRTLHYYDQIELLKPSRQKGNSYRVYDASSIVRLQQILFYKELGFELKNIKSILDQPGFDYLSALENHKMALFARAEQINKLIGTIEKTMQQMKNRQSMKKRPPTGGDRKLWVNQTGDGNHSPKRKKRIFSREVNG